MNRVVKILMDRDGMTEQEAQKLVDETDEALEAGEWDALQTYLGLEDDFLFDVLGF